MKIAPEIAAYSTIRLFPLELILNFVFVFPDRLPGEFASRLQIKTNRNN